jgi:ABC-type Fe3+/spermidine/putrescine transport system ATPase subunit
MSTQIAVMNHGGIVQLGTPRDIYETPRTTFVAQFIGASNLIAGSVDAQKGGSTIVTTRIGTVRSSRETEARIGDPVRISIRPESLELTDGSSPAGTNRLTGQVLTSSYVGDSVITMVRVGEVELRVRCKATDMAEPGATVTLTMPDEAIAVLPDDVTGSPDATGALETVAA